MRLEDTDQKRSSARSETDILAALRWLGLDWDEGPDVGGDAGPYRQSERSAVYRDHVERLLQAGNAFRCFCTPEMLAEQRAYQLANQLPQGYVGTCLNLSETEIAVRVENGESFCVRIRKPQEGYCTLRDELRGDIQIDWQQIDMQVLLKADGMPTYHLASVVDDHLMRITDVIRGEEWINSTPKHLLLYDYFGWTPPNFYHLPLLKNPDQSKVSKRKNPVSIHYYRDKGILPGAFLHYLATMGWLSPDSAEAVGLERMIALFDIKKFNLNGAIFDIEKLFWLSGQWLRAMSVQDFSDSFRHWLPDKTQQDRLLALLQPRVESFDQIIGQAGYLLGDIKTPSADLLCPPQSNKDTVKRILQFADRRLVPLENWERSSIEEALTTLATAMDIKIQVFLRPLFLAISGREVALPLFDSLALLGRDLTHVRLRSALTVLGGLSKKEQKALDKSWQMLVFVDNQ